MHYSRQTQIIAKHNDMVELVQRMSRKFNTAFAARRGRHASLQVFESRITSLNLTASAIADGRLGEARTLLDAMP